MLKQVQVYENGQMHDRYFDIPSVFANLPELNIFPGFTDVHVHFREPGFSYKETMASGSRAAAHGGYVRVMTMPNLNPVPDSVEHLEVQRRLIRDGAVIEVIPYGAITRGEKGEELADMEAMAPLVCAFSDDGRGVQDAGMMRAAMEKAKALGRMICAHCEDMPLVRSGVIHDGWYAREHGLPGICSESEWKQIERDLKLSAETGCAYHVCHISTKESVQLIRDAKKSGVNVSCETGPHYLVLCEHDLQDEGRFKMNPPLRTAQDREALLEGALDGTIDMIATDHAPHSAEEKSRGLLKSAMGIVGLETAFPVLYTHLVKKGIMPMGRLIYMLTEAPEKRFGYHSEFEKNYSIWSLGEAYRIDPADFLSQGKATPFAGDEVYGRCLETVAGGKTVWTSSAN